MDDIFKQTSEDGFHLVDSERNVAAKYDKDGFDVAKVSQHFIELLKLSGIAGDSPALLYFVSTNEAGFAIVDSALNIGVKVIDDGVHAKNILKFKIV